MLALSMLACRVLALSTVYRLHTTVRSPACANLIPIQSIDININAKAVLKPEEPESEIFYAYMYVERSQVQYQYGVTDNYKVPVL